MNFPRSPHEWPNEGMVPTTNTSPSLSDARLLFLLAMSTATVQVIHCPLHPFSASASKHTGLDSLPHHFDRSVQIELWLRPQLSFLLVLYHLEWQQCLWASWRFSLEMTWQQQLSHSFNNQEQAPMLPEGGTLRVQRKRGRVSLSKRFDWKSDTSINKVRVEQKWRKIDMTISHK
jgi:hypothetical protein